MDGQQCLTSNAQQLRVVRQLLWDVISLHLYPAERDEIRRALGNSLLDENETLFAEAGALADILGDVQLNTGALLARHQLCSNPQRSMVETEIRLLIDRLHASATATPYGSAAVRERDPDSLLPRSGKKDKAVLDYVATVAQIAETGGRPPSSAGLPPRPPTSLPSSSRPGTSSRPPTALSASASITLPSPLSRPGTASPTLLGSRPSTASSAASSAATRYTDAPSVVAGVADKLSVATIEAVRDTLRGALADERAALMEDIEYLQGLLDAEADLQVRAAAPPPSLAELKDYSSRLAAVVAEEEARVEHEVRVSAMFAAADQQQSKAGRLRGMVDASRRPTSGGAAGPSPAAGAGAAGRGRSASGSGGVGGSVGAGGSRGQAQTLVVHGDDEDGPGRSPQGQQQQDPGAASARASVQTLDLGASTSSSATLISSAATIATAAAAGLTAARGSPLSAVRRPGSGGSGATAPTASDPSSPLPPILSVRPSGPLPSTRHNPGHEPSSPAAPIPHKPVVENAATAAATAAAGTADSNGLAAPHSEASARLRQGSPGRLRLPLQGTGGAGAPGLAHPSGPSLLASATQQQQPHPQNPGSTPPHRDRSPSLGSSASPARSTAAAAAAAGSGSRSATAVPAPGLGLAARRTTGATTTTKAVTAAVGHKPASRSIPSGSGPGSASPAAAGTAAPAPVAAGGGPGLRPLLPRSGSVGATMTSGEVRRQAAAEAGVGSDRGTAPAATCTGRTPGSRTGAVAGAAAVTAAGVPAASPGSAVAARLAATSGGLGLPSDSGVVPNSSSSSSDAAASCQPTAVQPRALLGNRQSVVEQLDAEVDAVKGGVAAILERYNIRPSTPSGGAGAAGGVESGAGRAAGGGTAASAGTGTGTQRAAAR